MRKIYFLLLTVLFAAITTTNAQVSVTATAGTTGPSPYTTLKGAFDAINAGTHQGVITISLSGNTTETATAALNASGSGSASYASVSVTATVPVTVSGNITGAIIKLTGADNVTIDGRIGGVGRNITVSNTSTASATAAIWLTSTGAGAGATNNIIRNLEIACGVTQNTSSSSTFGIILCSNNTAISTTSNSDDCDNNSFISNRIIRCRYGIVTRGTTTNLTLNTIVADNMIGPLAFGPDQIGKVGIFMQADQGALIGNNTIQFVGGNFANTTGGADRLGIAIGSESWGVTASTTLTSNTYTIVNNIIHDIVEERTFSALGIQLATTGGGSPTNNLVANNMISNIRSNGTAGDQVCGIGIPGGMDDKVVFNSISITGDMDPTGTTSSSIYGNGIRISQPSSASHGNLTVKNNIINVDASSNTATVLYYDITANGAAYSFGSGGLNYNNYYINPANAQLRTGGLGTTSGNNPGTSFLTLANWQTAFTVPQDANSSNIQPIFVSATDLHLLPAFNPTLNNTGTPIAPVTVDIDLETRNAITPDMGADEFTPCGPPATATASNNSPVCAGTTLNLTGTTSGDSFLWTGPNGFSSTAQNPNIPNVTVAASGTYTFQAFLAGCASVPSTTNVVINPSPAISSVTATPPSVCLGGNSQLQVNSTFPFPVTQYIFSNGSGASLDPMVGATQVLNPSNDDTPTPAAAAIGFTFNYEGTDYTQYSVSPDGWIKLGPGAAVGEFSNVTTSATNTPKIYPYWDDVATGTNGAVHTLVTGSAPNRIFKVQWFVTIPRNTAGAANSTFQAWLYEGTNRIEFRYGTMNAGAMSASVGLTGIVPAPATDFNSVTIATNTNSTVIANDNNTGQPASGTIYIFNQPQQTYLWSPSTFLNNTAIANPMASAITSTTAYNVTVTANGCSSVGNVTVTMGTPAVSEVIVQPTTCVSTDGSITLTVSGGTGGVGPYSFAWTGTGVNPTAQNQTNLPVGSYTVIVTDIPSGCQNIIVYDLTGPGGCNVCPDIPSLTSTPPSPVCLGDAVTLTAAGLTNMGVTYGIRFKYSGTGLPLSNPYTEGLDVGVVPNGSLTAGGTQAALGTGALNSVGTFHFYAILDPVPANPACRPFATTAVVVNDRPAATATPPSQTICSGSAITTIALTSTIPGTTYAWTRNNTATVTGIAANGTGDISGSLTNTTFAPVTVTFTITPTSPLGCTGPDITATVLVNPTPLAIPTPTSQTRCSGVPIAPIVIANGVAGQLTIGISGTGFMDEVSYQLLDASNVVVQTGGPYAFGSTNLSAPVAATNGPYTLNIEAQGTFNDNAITWVVNCNGSPIANGCLRGTAAGGGCANVGTISVPNLNCAGTGVPGTTFTWTRNNTVNVTGMPDNGSGTPITGTLTNTTNTPQTVIFTITPSANGCPGTPVTASVLVNPTPNAVATPSTQTVCNGNPITTIVNTSAVAGTTYAWTRNNTVNVTGLANSGTGNISGTPINNTLVQQTVTYTITPTANGCAGPSTTATVIVNPTPTITCPANMTVPSLVGVCNTPVNYTPVITGTPAPTLTYSFSGATTGSGSGSGSGSLFNVGTTTVTITATNVCSAPSCSFIITVTDSQLPVITTQPASQTVCSGSNATFSVVATNVLTYQWQTWNGTAWVNVAGANASTFTVNNQTIANNTNSYRVILNGLCTVVTSGIASVFVNTNPIITLSSSRPPFLLPGQSLDITATGIPPGGTFVWLFNGVVMPGVTGNVLTNITVNELGSYSVRYTDPNGCITTSAVLVVTGQASTEMWVYPNPNFGQFQVRFFNTNPETATVNVYDSKGAKVLTRSVTTTLPYTTIDIVLDRRFPSGTYIVELVNGSGARVGARQVLVRFP